MFSLCKSCCVLQSGVHVTRQEYIKSEPVPWPNNDPVKVVVGKNYKDIVMDESKDGA